jgi:hypothetical protein
MDIGEFIDTYSDDLIYLHEGRAALLTHPLRSDYAFTEYLDPSFCRMLAVLVIGSIEAMLEAWRDRDHTQIIDKYLAGQNRKIRNEELIDNLYQAFTDSGIQVDRQVLDDYLAIKYLRNTIVHGRWKENEKKWLDGRGFPTDTRKLTKEHLYRIEHVNQNMMLYIFLTSLAAPNAPKPERLIRLDETVTRVADDTGIIRLRDINQIIWNNLERIDAHIYMDIEKTVTTEQYNWAEGRSRGDLERLGDAERKRLIYLAARRAGSENHEPLAQHRALANEALEFWREYWQRAVAPRGLDEESIQRAVQVFESPHFKPELPVWSLVGNLPPEVVHQFVDDVLGGGEPFTSEQVAGALRAGKDAYELIPNIMPVKLFTVRLPIVDPANTAVYLREAQRALNVFRLNRAWYSCVEDHLRFSHDESLDFYSWMEQVLLSAHNGSELRTGEPFETIDPLE